MSGFRTDLAMEKTAAEGAGMPGIDMRAVQRDGLDMTWVTVTTPEAARKLGKAQGTYWTLTQPELTCLTPEERVPIAERIGQEIKALLPERGDVLVLGLGNRRMTADALGDRVVSGILVTRHMKDPTLRSVCALAPGVLGVTGIETAEMASALVHRLKPAAMIVVDALAAMETGHICTTVQVTDSGISPGSGVGNHRAGINATTMGVPVVAVGIPMVVYTSTIVRDALSGILSREQDEESAFAMAEQLAVGVDGEMIVTPRDIDATVQSLADMLALAINLALQPGMSTEELQMYLH